MYFEKLLYYLKITKVFCWRHDLEKNMPFLVTFLTITNDENPWGDRNKNK